MVQKICCTRWQSYMTISISTAMSISSAISTNSLPSYVYQRKKTITIDTSTLEGSRTISSEYPRSWINAVRISNRDPLNDLKSAEDKEIHKTLTQELATSCAEVAALKENGLKLKVVRHVNKL